MADNRKVLVEFYFYNLKMYLYGRDHLVLQVQQQYDTAVDRLEQERQKYENYMFEEHVLTEVWEDSSAMVREFCDRYRKYSDKYGFRNRIGKVAREMAESINDMEKEMAGRIWWYGIAQTPEGNQLLEQRRKPFVLPDITAQVAYRSPWMDAVMECFLKKKKSGSLLMDGIGNDYKEVTINRVKNRYYNNMEEDIRSCQKTMAQVNRKVRVALELFLEEELKAVTGYGYRENCSQFLKLVNKLKEAGSEYDKVSEYLELSEEEKNVLKRIQQDGEIE